LRIRKFGPFSFGLLADLRPTIIRAYLDCGRPTILQAYDLTALDPYRPTPLRYCTILRSYVPTTTVRTTARLRSSLRSYGHYALCPYVAATTLRPLAVLRPYTEHNNLIGNRPPTNSRLLPNQRTGTICTNIFTTYQNIRKRRTTDRPYKFFRTQTDYSYRAL